MDTIDPGEPDALAASTAADFERTHGRPPVGVFAAPGRVNLIGEHVDYNGGLCLPMALPHATYAAVAPREDRALHFVSRGQEQDWSGTLDDLGPDAIDGWAAYAAGVVWAMREAGYDPPGMDVVLDSRVPLGAGLSSSAAIECAVALAVAHLCGTEVDQDARRELVRACMRAEADVAGAPTGGMDQTIALLGERESALLLDCRDWSTRQVGWDPAAAELTLLVVDTRASHTLSDGGYGSRRDQCEQAARALGVELLGDIGPDGQAAALDSLDDEEVRRRVRHVFTEIGRVRTAVEQLEAGDYDALGQTFSASHASLRDDYEVSCSELDAVVEASVEAGALGARMTGGGFGGSAIALVPTDRLEPVGDAVATAFEQQGWEAPGFLTALPSAGARRLL